MNPLPREIADAKQPETSRKRTGGRQKKIVPDGAPDRKERNG